MAPKGKVEQTKKGKQNKDAPKRYLSSYLLFTRDERTKVQEENPNIKFGQIAKILGQKWATLEQSKKQKYIDMAEKEKARYEKEMAAYENKGGSDE